MNLTPYSPLHDLIAALPWEAYETALANARGMIESVNADNPYQTGTERRAYWRRELQAIDRDIRGGWPPAGWKTLAVTLQLALMRCEDSPELPE